MIDWTYCIGLGLGFVFGWLYGSVKTKKKYRHLLKYLEIQEK